VYGNSKANSALIYADCVTENHWVQPLSTVSVQLINQQNWQIILMPTNWQKCFLSTTL